MQIQQVVLPYESYTTDGFLGLRPYMFDQDAASTPAENYHVQKSESLLYTLYKNKIIDNMIVAFYVHDQSYMTRDSSIKFGSYDDECFNTTQFFNGPMDTIDTNSWTISMFSSDFFLTNPLTGMQVLQQSVTGSMGFLIDPSLPFMYVPEANFNALS